jgi:putative addiction module killer protein
MGIQVELLRHINKLANGKFTSSAPAGEGVHELRIHFQKGYRIYFTNINGEIIILLVGGDKSTQSADIKKAQRLKDNL